MMPQATEGACISINGVRIDNVTRARALQTAMECKEHPCVVMTPNASMLDACRRDRNCARLLNAASLSLPDGAGVLLAAKRKGTPLCGQVTCGSFCEDVLAYAAEHALRVFLLGGKEGEAKRAAERLCRRLPSLQICGTYWGNFQKGGAENLRLRSYLHICRPDVLLVYFGFPQQETWVLDNLDVLSSVRVVAALRDGPEMWAERGHAPAAVRRCGLEWAWRMVHEPAKLRNLPSSVRLFLYNR